MRFLDQLRLMALLSLPSILAQVSSIIMQYIDAAMVGSLGAEASASIGIVSTTTWLFWGLCSAVVSGFSVQVAQYTGAKKKDRAQTVIRQALTSTMLFSAVLAVFGCSISGSLPLWLGGEEAIHHDATAYFFIFSLGLPAYQLGYLSGAVLRCSGNMFVPGMLNAAMCVLDVIFNALLIFPTREIGGITVYGAGLGVTGAAMGTVLAELLVGITMFWYMWKRSPQLNMSVSSGSFIPQHATLKKASRIGLPMAAEHAVMCGAQILGTVIVAPLGTVAIAANAFAITAESLCYMPGYGIGEAATTLVGQSIGASRRDLAQRFAGISVWSGMAVMSVMGIVMYLVAPQMMTFFTPDVSVHELGVSILRIEAWAEPMFAASIVSYGAFVGAGDTLIPCFMNLGSIWAVRLSLAAILAPMYGLTGVWVAMCVELCFRGAIFLWRLYSGAWLRRCDNIIR
ncbi:MAG: MATE family efflux transporter [Bacteroides sp.]|nr:MATE family efflux transporter [Roseburia sp.]MCM1346806.1 MATE family efflux transporter [Bacteroides sp.]MCM1421347.1 MATE family efflux transporter [Bacteroides sp.]